MNFAAFYHQIHLSVSMYYEQSLHTKALSVILNAVPCPSLLIVPLPHSLWRKSVFVIKMIPSSLAPVASTYFHNFGLAIVTFVSSSCPCFGDFLASTRIFCPDPPIFSQSELYCKDSPHPMIGRSLAGIKVCLTSTYLSLE